MSIVQKLLWTALFMAVSFSICCRSDCPPLEAIQFGTYSIHAYFTSYPDDDTIDNGTITITSDVEIVYQNDAGETWTVVYDIFHEE